MTARDRTSARASREQCARPSSTVLEVLALLHFPGLVALVMVLPVVAIGPLAFAIRQDFEFGQSDIGATFAAFFVTSALASGTGGRLVSRLGSLATVRCGLLGAACISIVLASSTSRETIYGAALVGGVCNGMTAVAVSLTILSQVEPHRRGLAFGLRMAGLPSAAAFGGLGAYLAAAGDLDWRNFYVATAAIALVAALVMRTSRRQPTVDGHPRPVSSVDGSSRTLVLLGVCGLIGSVGTATVTPFLVDGLIAQGQSPGTAASVLTIAGWFGIVSRVAVGAVSDRVPDPLVHLRSAAAFLLVLAASMAFLAVGHGVFLLVGATLTAFSLGLAWPGLFLFAALATHRRLATRAASQVQFGQHTGAVLGPAAFGIIATHKSFTAAWSGTSVMVSVAAVLLLVVARMLARGSRQAVDASSAPT